MSRFYHDIRFYHTIRAIFVKDLIVEFRAKEVLPSTIVLGLLIAWVLRLVGETAELDTTGMAAAALWTGFLFAGMLVQEHSFAIENKQDGMSGLLSAPVEPGSIYLAKLAVNTVMLALFELICVPIVIVVFDLHGIGHPVWLMGILGLGNIALSSVGTLFSAMVQVSRARGSLLSVLVLILLMPIMIPATIGLLWGLGGIDATRGGWGMLGSAGMFQTAWAYLLVFDGVFVTAGWLLFGFVVQE